MGMEARGWRERQAVMKERETGCDERERQAVMKERDRLWTRERQVVIERELWRERERQAVIKERQVVIERERDRL